MSMSFDDEIKRVIPSVVNVIASSSDDQPAEEIYNNIKFGLPNPAGKSGGACTSAFLKQQYAATSGQQGSWVDMLNDMHQVLKGMGLAQTPTLSSSRKIKKGTPMQIAPPGSGRRRAMLIGINYVGQDGELRSSHFDCMNLREFLKNVHNFREEEMMVLMDDGIHSPPTKENIENGFILLTKYSQPGDVVFVSFSGHGGRTEDLDGDEEDGWDSTLFPVDFKTTGQILDDDILKMLVKPMKAGVTTTVLMDCCHSGTVVDLPYTFAAGDAKMKREGRFNMEIVTDAVRPEPRRRLRPKISASKESAAGEDGATLTNDARVLLSPKPTKINLQKAPETSPTSNEATARVILPQSPTGGLNDNETVRSAPSTIPLSPSKYNIPKIPESSPVRTSMSKLKISQASPRQSAPWTPKSCAPQIVVASEEPAWTAKTLEKASSANIHCARNGGSSASTPKCGSSPAKHGTVGAPKKITVVPGGAFHTSSAATVAKAEELRRARQRREEAEQTREASR